MTTQEERNIKTALAILDDEIRGDVAAALEKMDPAYSMTWVYKSPKGNLFPREYVKKAADMKDVYAIEGRKYDIRNIIAQDDIVMIEMIESYPDPETKKVYKTPQVIVLEFKEGKIIRGRHYCDPDVSSLNLTDESLEKIYR